MIDHALNIPSGFSKPPSWVRKEKESWEKELVDWERRGALGRATKTLLPSFTPLEFIPISLTKMALTRQKTPALGTSFAKNDFYSFGSVNGKMSDDLRLTRFVKCLRPSKTGNIFLQPVGQQCCVAS